MPDEGLALGFDTSAAHCAAAVVSGDRVLALRIEHMAKGQAERLFPLLEETLAEAGIGWADLSVIGVGVGPGNFTGVRIAVAAARGLALSLRVPAVGISATEAAAADVPRPCRAVVALRGDEVVWQDFTDDGPPAGPALAAVADLPPGPVPLIPRWPLAVAIARLAATVRAHHARGFQGARDAPGEAVAQTPDVPAAPGGVAAQRASQVAGDVPADDARPAAVRADRASAAVASAGFATGAGLAGRPPATTAGIPRPAPLYLRPADAAPPRDPPPRILP